MISPRTNLLHSNKHFSYHGHHWFGPYHFIFYCTHTLASMASLVLCFISCFLISHFQSASNQVYSLQLIFLTVKFLLIFTATTLPKELASIPAASSLPPCRLSSDADGAPGSAESSRTNTGVMCTEYPHQHSVRSVLQLFALSILSHRDRYTSILQIRKQALKESEVTFLGNWKG